MKYIISLILLPIIISAQGIPTSIKNTPSDREMQMEIFKEDTQIIMNNPSKDTVYTIDAEVMDIGPSKIALSETYYPIDEENVVAVDEYGKIISLELVPIKSVVRVRLVKQDDEFVVVRIKVLKQPSMR